MPIVDARVIVVWATDGIGAVNTMHARYDDAVTPVQDVATAIRDAVQSHWLPSITDQTILQEVKVGDDISGAVATSGQAGTNSALQLPPNCAIGVTKVVSSGRNGRFFIPGLQENVVNGKGQIDNAVVTDFNTRLVTFLSDLEAAGVDLRVQQKDGSFAQIDSFSVRPFITRMGPRLDRARGF